ncbi:hypothetical protein HOG98_04470 [bacterium]|jgi:hypothetical protein|nr:hypothetical protein [bacterium]
MFSTVDVNGTVNCWGALPGLSNVPVKPLENPVQSLHTTTTAVVALLQKSGEEDFALF